MRPPRWLAAPPGKRWEWRWDGVGVCLGACLLFLFVSDDVPLSLAGGGALTYLACWRLVPTCDP